MVVPIEVKAGKKGALKSLPQFVFHKKSEIVVRFDMKPPGVQKVRHVFRTKDGSEPVSYIHMSLPLYMVEELPKILDEYRVEKSSAQNITISNGIY
ncbi:hypothetical protein QUF76_16585 [Desulfobacterales bacterium HSG16]|nr:hypothetical protein [Desulfobacterales bacterium HSG16]